MRIGTILLAVALAGCANSAKAEHPAKCLDLLTDSRVTVSGQLTLQLFAGAPNYESIVNGDAEERTLILELPTRMCANDAGFIEPSESFDRVHVSASEPAIYDVLASAVGRNVTISGEAFGSQTGHHHAPLVMLVDEVSVR